MQCSAITSTRSKRCRREGTTFVVWPREYRVACTQHVRWVSSGHPYTVELAANPDNEALVRQAHPDDLTREASRRAERDRTSRPENPAMARAMRAGAYND
jgi:hypothetical protein